MNHVIALAVMLLFVLQSDSLPLAREDGGLSGQSTVVVAQRDGRIV